ncbi:MAG TPA: hypothetical protein VGO43_01240 [Pyrinomonadaceae bacterium]|jgi:hypothetical protein|nr:hypothetical protein [Pyrinomonadaceae bacterium]
MKKPFLYRHFGIGRMPEPWASRVTLEGAVIVDEALRGSLTYKNFHRPGVYSNWRKVGIFSASLALTNWSLFVLKWQ